MFGGGGDARMMDQIFNLKFTSKQLVRQSAKCEREEKEERLKARFWAPTGPYRIGATLLTPRPAGEARD